MDSGGLRVALITGASTGIGLATARRLLEDGVFVILTARQESISRFVGAEFLRKFSHHWIRPLDVREAADRRGLIDEIDRDLGRLDILINNAAVVYRAPIELAYDFECKEQMLVNFHSPLELIKASLPLMRRSGGGHIINVSSAAGFLSVPTMGLYSASKHALEAASESLFFELAPWNIRVSIVEPGFISSDAYLRARLSLALDRAQHPCNEEYKTQSNLVATLIDRASALTEADSDQVARAVVGLINNSHAPLRTVVTLYARAMSFLKRMLPQSLFNGLISRCLAFLRSRMVAARETPPDNYKLFTN